MKPTADQLRTYTHGIAILAHEHWHHVETVQGKFTDWPQTSEAFQLLSHFASTSQAVAMESEELHVQMLAVLDDDEISNEELAEIAPSVHELNAGIHSAWEDANKVWGMLKPAAKLTPDAADYKKAVDSLRFLGTHWLKWIDLVAAFLDDDDGGGTDPDPDPEPDFPSLDDVPEGQHPVVYFAKKAIAEWDGEGDLEVLVPGGSYKGFAFVQKETDWTGLSNIVPPKTDKRITIRAPRSTIIEPSGGKGWGESLTIKPVPGWAGNLTLRGFDVMGSGNSHIAIGRYCLTGAHETLAGIVLQEMSCIDGERVTRPISANGSDVTLIDFLTDIANGKEHAFYGRNMLGFSALRWNVKRVPGQFYQEVNRSDEYGDKCWTDIPRAMCEMVDCLFARPHLHDERAGSGITLAGSPHDWLFLRCGFWDDGVGKNHPVPSGDTYGGFSAWDGAKKGPPMPGTDRYNGNVRVEDCWFVWKNPNRKVFGASNVQSLPCENVSVYGVGSTKPIDIHDKAHPFDWVSPYPESHLELIEKHTPFKRGELLKPEIRDPDTGQKWPSTVELSLN